MRKCVVWTQTQHAVQRLLSVLVLVTFCMCCLDSDSETVKRTRHFLCHLHKRVKIYPNTHACIPFA
jgi:hypothetical protein